MNVETSGLAESFATILAAEGSALAVGVLVVSQVVLSPKGLATHITGKWSLICVGPLMDEQVVGLGELPVAELANEPFLGLGKHGSMWLLLVKHMLKKEIRREM